MQRTVDTATPSKFFPIKQLRFADGKINGCLTKTEEKMKETESFQSYKRSPYKSIKHSTYFHSYDHFFQNYRNREITFVEIGVLGGGSLFMWRDYFGPKARIIGVDLNPNAKKWEADGFEIYIGSQSNEEFWSEFKREVGGIDVVLDDGGHTYEQQIITSECLLSAINDGGMILVEDTHTSYMEGFGPKSKSFIEYTKLLIDNINMRFGKFDSECAEKRVWSVEIVESMVAFKIHKDAAKLLSEPTNNGGKDDKAEDYRYAERKPVSMLQKLVRELKFLKHVPLARYIYGSLDKIITNRSFAANKYFKK